MMKWNLVTKKIKELKPHPKNPRILTKDQQFQLDQSIEKFGLIEKPIITNDNQIIGGHQRIQVLKKNGEKEVECWQAQEHLDESQIDELCIRLNKNTGEFDFEMLANAWELDNLIEWGFKPHEFDILLGEESLSQTNQKQQGEKCPTCGKKSTKGSRKTE